MATEPIGTRAERAAHKVRALLVKAKEERHYVHGWYADLDRVDIELMIEELIGPMPVESSFTLPDGSVLHNVHDPEECQGRGCAIHHPSDHHMVTWRLNWRGRDPLSIKPPHFERICPHGIGHPDPDSSAYLASIGADVGVHGCDGCCAPAPPLPKRVA